LIDEMRDPFAIFTAAAPNNAEYLIAAPKKELRQIGSVLSSQSGD
jgi:hypothetical protein